MLLERTAKLFSKAEIVSLRPDHSLHRYTYGDFYRRARALAEQLQRAGIALLGIGRVGNAPGSLERLDVEEAQSAQMVGHRTRSQFVHGEELGLVFADVSRP